MGAVMLPVAHGKAGHTGEIAEGFLRKAERPAQFPDIPGSGRKQKLPPASGEFAEEFLQCVTPPAKFSDGAHIRNHVSHQRRDDGEDIRRKTRQGIPRQNGIMFQKRHKFQFLFHAKEAAESRSIS